MPIDEIRQPALFLACRRIQIERAAGGDQPAVGGNHAHADMIGREPGQGACVDRVVAKQGQRRRRGRVGHRGIVHVEGHVIGGIGAGNAQLDAVTGAILLPFAGQAFGKRAITVDHRRIEIAGCGTGDAVAA